MPCQALHPRFEPTEEEVRVQLCATLMACGWELTCERKLADTRQRYDVGLHLASAEDPVALIEVKRAARAKRPPRSSRQRRAYEASGIPYRYCLGAGDIPELVEWANKLRAALLRERLSA